MTGVLIGRVGLAVLLGSAVGLEREFRHKPAGLRTLTLVSVGAAVAMIVSKYGFADMTEDGVDFDPSRVAAQIVSGIGFLGAGIIFVRRDSVSGLTTAAVVWLTAMIGMAVGAGLLAVAVVATVLHFLVAVVYPVVVRRLPRSPWAPTPVEVHYVDHRGVLRELLGELTHRGFAVSHLVVDRSLEVPGRVAVTMHVIGKGHPTAVAAAIAGIDGVISVGAGETDGP